MTKSNVKVVKSSNSILSEKDVEQLEKWLNRQSEYNLQKYDQKKRVSFYDDDMFFYFTLSLPVADEADFDNAIMDLIDDLGGMFGITEAYCKGWL
tara:strand:- start:515 stop:799 length:285 start_codon:yes stop_codon:yes gene_type:complete